MATPCCPTDVKPVVNNYKGVGKMVKLENGLEMYVTGTGAKAVVNVTDIFGVTPNSHQFADRLSEVGGFVVCVPDLVVDPWSPENIPPTKDGKFPEGVEPSDGLDVLMDWIINHHNMRHDRHESLSSVKSYLEKEYGVTKIGAVGMCWGSKVAWTSQNKHPGLFDALAACHGSFMEKSDVEGINVPQCFLNSKDEPESYANDIKPVFARNDKRELNVWKDFPTVHHGWMATRGIGSDTDFNDSEVANKFKEGVSDLANFFRSAFEDKK